MDFGQQDKFERYLEATRAESLGFEIMGSLQKDCIAKDKLTCVDQASVEQAINKRIDEASLRNKGVDTFLIIANLGIEASQQETMMLDRLKPHYGDTGASMVYALRELENSPQFKLADNIQAVVDKQLNEKRAKF